MRGRLTETHCADRNRKAQRRAGKAGSGVAPVEAALGAEWRQGEELCIGQEGEEGAAAQQADAFPVAQQWDPRQQRGEGGQRESLAAAPGAVQRGEARAAPPLSLPHGGGGAGW